MKPTCAMCRLNPPVTTTKNNRYKVCANCNECKQVDYVPFVKCPKCAVHVAIASFNPHARQCGCYDLVDAPMHIELMSGMRCSRCNCFRPIDLFPDKMGTCTKCRLKKRKRTDDIDAANALLFLKMMN